MLSNPNSSKNRHFFRRTGYGSYCMAEIPTLKPFIGHHLHSHHRRFTSTTGLDELRRDPLDRLVLVGTGLVHDELVGAGLSEYADHLREGVEARPNIGQALTACVGDPRAEGTDDLGGIPPDLSHASSRNRFRAAISSNVPEEFHRSA